MDIFENLILTRWTKSFRNVFFMITVCLSVIVSSLPIPKGLMLSKVRIKRAPIYDNVQTYLTKFGYLPQSDIETGNLRTDEQLKEAIRNLQRYGNIPATGEVDSETAELLKRPRCGLPDFETPSLQSRRKRWLLHGQRWDHINLTWSLQSKYLSNLSHGRVRAELSRALAVWSKHSRLTFRETLSDDADILVYFESGYHGDSFPFDGRGQILAHAFFPGPGRGGDAHFDEQEVWLVDGNDTPDGTSLFAVAAHEFGHSLGLAHSSVSGALMFPWYQGMKYNFVLPEDDREAIEQLYGSKDDPTTNDGRIYTEERTHKPYKYPKSERPTKSYPEYPKPPKKVAPSIQTPVYIPSSKPEQSPRSPSSYKPALKPNKPPGEPPDTCDTTYDAVSVIRRDTFIFKGKHIWRIGDNGLYPGYPNLIDRLWYKLPSNLTHVDAVYEKYDGKIVFFIGRSVYLFNGNVLIPGYPKPLTSLGLPASLDRIDGAMVWGYNSRTYFFSGTMYWRFDEEVGHVELDYPRDMSVWKGVGYNIDAVFQWKDGATYFFKGKGFWKFNDAKMRVTNKKQTPSAPFWMGCPAVLESKHSSSETGAHVQGLSDCSIPKINFLTISAAISYVFINFVFS